MSEIGKANYEAYRFVAGGKSIVTGDQLPEYDELPPPIQLAWDGGADAVKLWLSEQPADEDAPGSEPQSAKVIVVTEHNGRERRFAADNFTRGLLGLTVQRDAKDIAYYPNGTFFGVRDADAEVPDGTARALGIAKRALSEIVKRSNDGGEQPFGRPEIGTIAADALNEIWNETEA